jgi:hypothetical protein
MSVTALSCPGCGAPAPAASGTCDYCGATLQVTAVSATGSGPRVDLVFTGLTHAHVPVLVAVLGRPAHIMAAVPHRGPGFGGRGPGGPRRPGSR